MTQETDDRLAALVADLEELHAVELQEIRAARELAAREADGNAAAEKARSDERRDAFKRVEYWMNSKVTFALRPVRQAVEYKNAAMESLATPLREQLPRLKQETEVLRGMVRADPWAEGRAVLDTADAKIASADSYLAQFDALRAGDEATRRRRLGLPEESEAPR